MTEWHLSVPVRTPRTLLRPHRLSDDADLLRFHSDPEVTRYLPWPVRDLDAVRATLQDKVEQTHLSTDGAWLSLAVELAPSGRVVGEALLRRTEAATGTAEVGYAFARDVHGQGYGTEVVRALLDVTRRSLPVHQVLAHVEADNTASLRLLARLGFREVDRKDGHRPGSLHVHRLDLAAGDAGVPGLSPASPSR